MEAAAVAQIHPEIAELRPGQRFEGRYACLRKDRLTARNGSTYLSLRLRDRSGAIAARVFRDADRIGLRFERRRRGRPCAARPSAIRGELSAELDDVRRLDPESFEPTEFLPAAYRSVAELEGFLEHLVREVHDPALREVVERVVIGGPLAADFRRAPCTRAGHHAYLGGLIEHTVAVGTLVGEVCQLHPRLDSDLLMAAAIVHDVGKRSRVHLRGRVRDQRGGADARPPRDRRRRSSLKRPPRCRRPRRLALLNCVLSHHGPDSGPGRAQAGARLRLGGGARLYRLNALDASVKGALEHGTL